MAKGYNKIIDKYDLKFGIKELKDLIKGDKGRVKIKYPLLKNRDEEYGELEKLLKELNNNGFELKYKLNGNLVTVDHIYQPDEITGTKIMEGDMPFDLEPKIKENAFFSHAAMYVSNQLTSETPLLKLFDTKEVAFQNIRRNLLEPLKKYVDSHYDYNKAIKQVLPELLNCQSKVRLNKIYNSVLMAYKARNKETQVRNSKKVVINEIKETMKMNNYKKKEIDKIEKYINEKIINPLITSNNTEELFFLAKFSAKLYNWVPFGPEKLMKNIKKLAKKAEKKSFHISVLE